MAAVESTKTKKVAKEATHPKYSEMIAIAIESLKQRGGSSRAAIIKFITSKYKVSNNPNIVNGRLKLALKKGVESGSLVQVKGTGAFGSFKLAKKATEKLKKAVKSPKAAKSSKAAKSPKEVKSKKKAAKKPKTIKSSKTVAKSPKKGVKSPKKSTKSPGKLTKPKPKKTATGKSTKKVTKSKAKNPTVEKPTKK